MRGLWHTTSRFFLLKIPFSDKDSGQKDKKKQKNTAISNMIMLCVQTGSTVMSSKTYECVFLRLLPHSLSCKETVKVTVKRL